MIRHLNWLGLLFVSLLLLLLFLGSRPAEERLVLLSFDVESVDGGSVMPIAALLDSQHINATFFVTGEFAEQYPDILRNISHFDIGCHSYSHPVLTKLTDKQQSEQVSSCKDEVEKVIGRPVTGFRAPYLRLDRATFQVLDQAGYLYDASIVSGLSTFYPKPTDMGEIPVSSVLGIPMMDIYFLYYTKTPRLFFYFLQNKNTHISSFLFHPHHVVNYQGQLNKSITMLKTDNAIFISHSGLIRFHEGG